jgi:hypothetical protein
MRKLAVLVIAAVALPAPGYACLNEVQRTVDEVWLVQHAEKQLESGQYASAKKTLGSYAFKDARLRERAKDVQIVVKLRTRKPADDLAPVVTHLEARHKGKKDPRFAALLAEAYVATSKTDEARSILVDLHKRDLMPDEHGYLALAKLSTGAERYAAWKACRTKAKNKSMCELPSELARK